MRCSTSMYTLVGCLMNVHTSEWGHDMRIRYTRTVHTHVQSKVMHTCSACTRRKCPREEGTFIDGLMRVVDSQELTALVLQ